MTFHSANRFCGLSLFTAHLFFVHRSTCPASASARASASAPAPESVVTNPSVCRYRASLARYRCWHTATFVRPCNVLNNNTIDALSVRVRRCWHSSVNGVEQTTIIKRTDCERKKHHDYETKILNADYAAWKHALRPVQSTT